MRRLTVAAAIACLTGCGAEDCRFLRGEYLPSNPDGRVLRVVIDADSTIVEFRDADGGVGVAVFAGGGRPIE